ncbi:carbohydrate esterase family 5 protein [Zopfia rhizophila CBS 207.26]|uniref:Carbohydrate esterase family 5 protein n=1 Tax=Zopfia rhizophila CBS 207.26 TaxID=1314779 RepID=A0A6A6DMI4_9PEZI|nr:carbohydrate esterase family 5 protein [Zopfia rhizophila CBS 207.26]
MLSTYLPLALLVAQGVSAFPLLPDLLQTRQSTACASVHVFIARGSNEEYPGRQSAVVSAVCSGISSCNYEDITYPATFDNYCVSAGTGVSNGMAQIRAYAAKCPSAKLVLTGYSQGAHVVGDILGGGGGVSSIGCTQATNTGFSPTTSPGSQIVAATLFGDVRHVAFQSYNVGTAPDKNGLWPRADTQLTNLNRWSSILSSWCDSGDPVCGSGLDVNAHLAYFGKYSSAAGEFVKSKLG